MTQKSKPINACESTIDRWASQPLKTSAKDFLAAIRSEIPVSLIATPRNEIICESKRNWKSIDSNPKFIDFDQVPLIDKERHIVGVYLREKGCLDLREDMFMAADAPLLSFLESADKDRFRFLMVDNAVSGIVTISDIQKLPVYSVLFSLVVAVEMLLMEWIRKTCRTNPNEWLSQLSKNDRNRIEGYWQDAVSENLAIDHLSCASFGQEIKAAKSLGLFKNNDSQFENIKALEKLRNKVCHAKEFASNLPQALKIPSEARNAHSIIIWLQEQNGTNPV